MDIFLLLFGLVIPIELASCRQFYLWVASVELKPNTVKPLDLGRHFRLLILRFGNANVFVFFRYNLIMACSAGLHVVEDLEDEPSVLLYLNEVVILLHVDVAEKSCFVVNLVKILLLFDLCLSRVCANCRDLIKMILTASNI